MTKYRLRLSSFDVRVMVTVSSTRAEAVQARLESRRKRAKREGERTGRGVGGGAPSSGGAPSDSALAEDLLDVLHVVVDRSGLARWLRRGVRRALRGNRRAGVGGQRAGGLVRGPRPRGDLGCARPALGRLVLAAGAGGAAGVTGRPATL